jgi:S-phase kinase-associated protein 1
MFKLCSLFIKIIIAIPLPNVTGPILTKVIDYCTHHRNDPIQNHDDDLKKTSEDIDDWDAEFCKVDQGTLFELILVNKIILHMYE